MEIKDCLYRITRNILPSIRGLIRYMSSMLIKGVSFSNGSRIGKGCEWVLHPGCKYNIGKGFNCGRYSTISVMNTGRLEIGNGVGIGKCNQIVCHNFISIGEGTLFGPNVMVYDHNHKFNFDDGVDRTHYDVGEVSIGKSCWIGANVVILKDVHIGDNCVIGAGSVVTKDIPSYSIAVGNPARVIKSKE